MEAKVSIITPVYNAAATLQRCIESVLNQTEQNFQLILINDGSKDNSGEICDRYAAADSRIVVIHQQNQGVSAARNAGLDIVSGEFITFLDSDDYLRDDMLSCLLHEMESSCADIVISGFAVWENGVKTRENVLSTTGLFDRTLWNDICIHTETYGYLLGKLFKRETIQKNAIHFNTKMYSQEDLDFCLSVYNCCGKFGLIEYSGYQYQYAPGKRTPPIFDFLANQMKLYRLANENTNLTEQAIAALTARVELLIYCALYELKTAEAHKNWIAQMNRVDDLPDFLRVHHGRTKASFVTQLAAKGHYKMIAAFFALYKGAKKLVRR